MATRHHFFERRYLGGEESLGIGVLAIEFLTDGAVGAEQSLGALVRRFT